MALVNHVPGIKNCKVEQDGKIKNCVINFADEDMKNGLTVEEAERIAKEFCEKNFQNHSFEVTVHNDENGIHCHVIYEK